MTLKEGAIVVLIRPSSEGQSGGGESGGQPQGGGPGPPGALGLANLAILARAAALAGRWHQAGCGVVPCEVRVYRGYSFRASRGRWMGDGWYGIEDGKVVQ